MTRRIARQPRIGSPQAAALLLLVAVTLAPTFAGRAGFLGVEQTVAARMFALHQHGVPGEAEYIRAFGQPAPFIHGHCHDREGVERPESPAQLALGGLLFGPALCGDVATLPPSPTVAFDGIERQARGDAAAEPRPVTPPPQA